MIAKQHIPVLQKALPTESLAIGVLSLLYLVGIIGIITSIYPDFILLTPVNLLLSFAIVIAFHPYKNRSIYYYLLLAYLVGFGAELYGVQTGILFGEYTYGRVLGPKIWDTPWIIGINWALLSYSIGITINQLVQKWNWLPKGILGALFMVTLDLIIEPVAIRYGFWSWSNGTPPLQNYVGWFFVSLPLLCIFAKMHGNVRNKVAIALFILQILFFFDPLYIMTTMQALFYILVTLAAVAGMELVAWAAHKYLMHGLLWNWHEDHHKPHHEKHGFFEKNDRFFLVFAIPSMIAYIIGATVPAFHWVFFVGVGISIYGAIYFLIHDVYIHRRFKWFKQLEGKYSRAILRAHGAHHAKHTKEDCESFGLLVVHPKFFKKRSEWKQA